MKRLDSLDALRGFDMLFIMGLAALVSKLCLALGLGDGFWRWSFPFSKVLWSPSFTLVVGGYSAAAFALFYWLIDVRGIWRRTLFLRVVGLNAIAIYMAQPVVGLGTLNKNLFGRLAGLFPSEWGAVVMSATYLLVCWSLLYAMYRKNVFLKC